MACAHPLLNVYYILYASWSALNIIRHLCVRIRLLCALKITSEMLEQRDLLLKIFGVVGQGVLTTNVLSIGTSALHVVEMEAV